MINGIITKKGGKIGYKQWEGKKYRREGFFIEGGGGGDMGERGERWWLE